MASGPHTFVTCVEQYRDYGVFFGLPSKKIITRFPNQPGQPLIKTPQVFSAERFQGNPLAIVSVRGNALSQQRKSLIAKEFGYSETVFLHDAPGPGLPRKAEIFTERGQEIPFAGHPIIGTTHYIFSQLERGKSIGTSDRDAPPLTAMLLTKAGQIPIFYDNFRQLAACTVPHNVHIHNKTISLEQILAVQPQVQIVPTSVNLKGKGFPVVSIVKGMTFALVDLTDAPEVMASLEKGKEPEVELDEGWAPSFVGALYYSRAVTGTRGSEPVINNIHARMITQGIEDPGTGSACCALGCYLALTAEEPKLKPKQTETEASEGVEELTKQTETVKLDDKPEHHVFAVEQGVEMGRKCMIAVEVDIKKDLQGNRKVSSVILSGRSNMFLAGQILGD